ncbi:hypothetical protein [Solibacillus sp. FSL K6-1523]|uniref:hypothetical protein n=1 Tax=Solibacillus sp. FSL K6-1523 TaxID=2921471 RepID=UPI0030F63E5F
MIASQVLEKQARYTKSQLNQDDLWKKVIADLFEDFLLFFLPEFHAEVDFSKPIDFLQQELFKEIIEERKGRKMADQIAKVILKNGEEQWVLVHTEVQTDDDEDFPQRMFEYYYRIFDRYDKKIVAIALFTKPSRKSSNEYKYVYFGTEVSYTFNKYVIADFDVEELKESPKLFSKALLASIYMNRSNKKMSLRRAYKRALLRELLILKDVNRTEITAIFYFVDYLLKLPKEMLDQLQQEIRAEIREEDEMMLESFKGDLPPTLAGILEMERQEGIELGIEKGIEQGIEIGREQEREKVVWQMIVSLIENGVTDMVIAHAAKRPIEQVQAIRNEMESK